MEKAIENILWKRKMLENKPLCYNGVTDHKCDCDGCVKNKPLSEKVYNKQAPLAVVPNNWMFECDVKQAVKEAYEKLKWVFSDDLALQQQIKGIFKAKFGFDLNE